MRSSISSLSYYITGTTTWSIVILKVQPLWWIQTFCALRQVIEKQVWEGEMLKSGTRQRGSIRIFFFKVRDQKLQWKYTACFTLSDASAPPAVFHPNMECNIQTLTESLYISMLSNQASGDTTQIEITGRIISADAAAAAMLQSIFKKAQAAIRRKLITRTL